mmetsp:Transcript_10496/g.22749  ORF Transcript_10496/g.22749 Transcript_10496/m.22749 type:complete len:414 (+) Transcript_10496:341-1582(+)
MTTSYAPRTDGHRMLSDAAASLVTPKDQDEEKRGGDESSTMPSGEGGSVGSGGSLDDAREEQLAEASRSWDRNAPWPMKNIASPGINDCLMGRGGGTNHHSGNKRFRAITEARKHMYLASKRLDKPIVAMEIVNEWRALEPPGRFLRQDEATKLWYDVGDQKAREKTSQALREKMTYAMVGEEGAVVEKLPGAKEIDQEDKKGIWTEAEMKLVRDAQKELGNKWSEVAKRVPGRSENSVKNWWYNHQTSEKRKKKRKEKALNRPVIKYNHALIPFSHQGQQEDGKSSLDNQALGEDTGQSSVINFSGTSTNNGGGWLTTHGMTGGTSDYGSFESVSDEGSKCAFGSIGYKFSRRLEDENGLDLGWHVGVVVDILSGIDKNRRCLYYENGFIEDLSLADLKELARLESNSHRAF